MMDAVDENETPNSDHVESNSECAPNNNKAKHDQQTDSCEQTSLMRTASGDSTTTSNVRKSVNFSSSVRSRDSVLSTTNNAPDHNNKRRSKLSRQPFSKLRNEVKFDQQKLAAKPLLNADKPLGVILPWDPRYKAWWGFSVFWSIMTVFFETYQIAFAETGFDETGLTKDGAFIIGYVFVAVFSLDMILNFNLAFFDHNDDIVTDRKRIAGKYLKCMFWVDLMGVFPFYNVAVAIAGADEAQDSEYLSLLRLLRLFRLVRLHRVKQLFDALQFNTHVSLMTLTLVRNFGTALVWTHFSACVMYYISRQYDFHPESTWIGGDFDNLNTFERYLTSLYWSVVTFTTVGYGDYSPVNAAEMIWGVTYMLLNMVLAAWMIGSITLLIVKTDEQTGHYRDTLKTLDVYSQIHNFDTALNKRLRSQMKLYFSCRQLADEEVLKNFPTLTRRKVLKRLYLPAINQSSLVKGVSGQFIDAFLCCCRVEIFSPGDEMLQRGSNSTELYLLVEGDVDLVTPINNNDDDNEGDSDTDLNSNNGMTGDKGTGYYVKTLAPGHFINDISFFTNTPMLETVQTTTICKALTLPMAEFKLISEDHPGSVGQILQNLLIKIEGMADTSNDVEFVPVREDDSESPMPPKIGGLFVDRNTSGYRAAVRAAIRSEGDMDDSSKRRLHQAGGVKASVKVGELEERQNVVRMHIDKLKDDQVARLLFAASRGDTTTIASMCDQGFDVNCVDYDDRSALMVAAAKGSTETAKRLLEYNANPNMRDVNGFTALYDAIRHGHDSTMDVIIEAGGKLLMSREKAAAELSKAVIDGQNGTLRRLLKAGINVHACGYDKRTAVHAAALSGNLDALKLLVEFGADMTVKDIWDNSAYDDAIKSQLEEVIQYVLSRVPVAEKSTSSGWFK